MLLLRRQGGESDALMSKQRTAVALWSMHHMIARMGEGIGVKAAVVMPLRTDA